MDSLDMFKKEYEQPQVNFQPPNQNQMQEEKFIQQSDLNKQNDLAKNLANFYGVTPPRTG